MNVNFQINYRTAVGESLFVVLDGDSEHPKALQTIDGENWQGRVECEFPDKAILNYRYEIYRDGICVRHEIGSQPHRLPLTSNVEGHYRVYDYWRDVPQFEAYYTTALGGYNNVSLPQSLQASAGRMGVLRILSPALSYHQLSLALIGGCDALGQWNPARALRFREIAPNCWQLALNLDSLPEHFEYKLAAVDNNTGLIKYWEDGANRIFDKPGLDRNEILVLPEEEYYFHTLPQLKIAGSAIPVFSLRSEGSCGIGDFGDLKLYLRWAESTKQKAVQILPINDTTAMRNWEDSYPYNAISIYALHPLYTDLRQLPPLKNWEYTDTFETKRKALNQLSLMDYDQVMHLKMKYLHTSYLQDGLQVSETSDYQAYVSANKEWLYPYAAFCELSERFGTNDFTQWNEYTVYDERLPDKMANDAEVKQRMEFYFYVQYQLHVQLKAVSDFARANHILLKGDIPIGINRYSVESWTEPRYFHLDGQAGAPPDAFSELGQNWGFPTYNWEAMAADGYKWWKRRFSKMSEYFSAYRIDHILGFFRIWEIPESAVNGLLGRFSPSLPFTIEEIRSFGLQLDEDRMTRPYVDDVLLQEYFGKNAAVVRRKYFEEYSDGSLGFKAAYNTERKIETALSCLHLGKAEMLRPGLYELINNVLFIRDRDDECRFHPRIAVQKTQVFRTLDDYQQQVLNRLYNHYYYERHNEFWYQEAMRKLSDLIFCTPMLVCGEDLGMVPDCVPWVMNQLQILSLEIQRMPKLYGEEFGNVMSYPYTSVCTLGTHDMTTLRGWWKEDRNRTERFAESMLQWKGDIPEDLTAELAQKMIIQHLNAPSMLCIFAWQDWLAMDDELKNPDIDIERINVPANPRHYWRWRMHITLENLMEQTAFNDLISRLITDSGRS